jgi:phospholipase A-2-activating protein
MFLGSADKYIRLFDRKGKLLKRFLGSDDVIRALVKLPSQNSPAQFASAGNDSKIRLWTMEGVLVAELYGHENFIYSLAVLPTGEIASSSEDRTVRIWKNTQCIQTITHPAISVWSVAVCHQNGDIVTGASDKAVRVFSRSQERNADEKTLKEFEDSVQASSIPQQSLGEINRTDMPGPEFLQQKSGTKEGQVQLIKERNGNVAAYQWSVQGNTWVNVGTVVDATGTANKISYNGKDYDYVFDVDIEDGKPPLKLPYNANENPYEVARKFIEENKLPMTYLDEVTNFITKNSQGTAIGEQTHPQGQASDPWGTESRYRPGEVNTPGSTPSAPTQNILPQKQYLAISTGNHQMILKKIKEFNQQLLSDGSKDLVLNEKDLAILDATIKKLEPMAGKQEASISIDTASINATIRAVSEWPIDKRLPWLDLLRLLTAASGDPVTQSSSDSEDLVSHLTSSGAFSKDTPANSVMLAVRTLANLFCSPAGRSLADAKFEEILSLIEPHVQSSNKNLSIALTTLYINYAVLFTNSKAADATPNPDRALGLLAALMELLKTTNDAEALYRALVAAGTVLCLGKDFADVAKEGLDIEDAIDRAQTVSKEERIKKIVTEIRGHLTP